MFRRSTWIILIAFAILLAGTLFWQQSKMKKASSEPTPTAMEEAFLFETNDATITGLVLQRSSDGKTLEFQHAESAWKLVKPSELAEGGDTDSAAVEAALSSLLSARIVAKPSGATDLAILGLEPPSSRILVMLDNGEQININIGKVTATGSGYYALTEARVIYVVNKYSLDAVLGLLDAPPIVVPPTSTPVDLSVTTPITATLPAVTP